jgi:hypothetical protein
VVLESVTVISVDSVLTFDYQCGRFGILVADVQPGSMALLPGDIGRLVLPDAFGRIAGLIV